LKPNALSRNTEKLQNAGKFGSGVGFAGSRRALVETPFHASAKGAPPWLGLREPQSLEATIVSAADRLSGHSDLIEQHAPRRSGFGRYHPHLGGRPYVLAEAN
jgi:hypothetical protein